MQVVLLWLLETAPSWAMGLIIIAVLRWMSAKGLSFFLSELLDLEGRLQRGLQTQERLRDIDERGGSVEAEDVWRIAEQEGGPLPGGCAASLAAGLPVFLLGLWVTVDVWLLLESSQNPAPALGRRVIWSALAVWAAGLILGWISVRPKLDEWRDQFDESTIWTMLGLIALGQFILYLLAPSGMHLYWLTQRVLGVADERWFSGASRGDDIRTRPDSDDPVD